MREGVPTGVVLLLLVVVQWYYLFKASQVVASDSALCQFERYCRLSGGERSSDSRCRLAGPLDDSPNICMSSKARWCRLYPFADECAGFVQTRSATDWKAYYDAQNATAAAARR
ncbi:hypothetical protein KFE25_006412 [Diacronema lutheri]|uniref:Uncharacterized protein n=2 Tax=Diacronema lutheri TaxID=2081491 RepID=A0A8J6CCJ4_DIALT|nr:hypothetical protein KFE25_006412 [Diacronema lutheri]